MQCSIFSHHERNYSSGKTCQFTFCNDSSRSGFTYPISSYYKLRLFLPHDSVLLEQWWSISTRKSFQMDFLPLGADCFFNCPASSFPNYPILSSNSRNGFIWFGSTYTPDYRISLSHLLLTYRCFPNHDYSLPWIAAQVSATNSNLLNGIPRWLHTPKESMYLVIFMLIIDVLHSRKILPERYSARDSSVADCNCQFASMLHSFGCSLRIHCDLFLIRQVPNGEISDHVASFPELLVTGNPTTWLGPVGWRILNHLGHNDGLVLCHLLGITHNFSFCLHLYTGRVKVRYIKIWKTPDMIGGFMSWGCLELKIWVT